MKRFVVKNMCTDVSDEANSTVIRKKNWSGRFLWKLGTYSEPHDFTSQKTLNFISPQIWQLPDIRAR